ncbi:MAG: hypothetical protein PHD04_02870 [Candidatus Pacebacteria bacterium]|nr:hypothetical protein [Candidatus Paceibacterota bacterium]
MAIDRSKEGPQGMMSPKNDAFPDATPPVAKSHIGPQGNVSPRSFKNVPTVSDVETQMAQQKQKIRANAQAIGADEALIAEILKTQQRIQGDVGFLESDLAKLARKAGAIESSIPTEEWVSSVIPPPIHTSPVGSSNLHFGVTVYDSTNVSVHGGTWYRRVGDTLEDMDLATAGPLVSGTVQVAITGTGGWVWIARCDATGILYANFSASIPTEAALQALYPTCKVRDLRIIAKVTMASSVITNIDQLWTGGNIHDEGRNFQMFEICPVWNGSNWDIRIYQGTWVRMLTTTTNDPISATIADATATGYDMVGAISEITSPRSIYVIFNEVPSNNLTAEFAAPTPPTTLSSFVAGIVKMDFAAGIPYVTQVHLGYYFEYKSNLDSQVAGTAFNSLEKNSAGNAGLYGFDLTASKDYMNPYKKADGVDSDDLLWRFTCTGVGHNANIPGTSNADFVESLEDYALDGAFTPPTQTTDALTSAGFTNYIYDAGYVYLGHKSRPTNVANGTIDVQALDAAFAEQTMKVYLNANKLPKYKHTSLSYAASSPSDDADKKANTDHDYRYARQGGSHDGAYETNLDTSVNFFTIGFLKGVPGQNVAGPLRIELEDCVLHYGAAGAEKKTVDWANGYLYDPDDGTTARCNWDDGYLYEDGGNPSVSWITKKLSDSGTDVLNWDTQVMMDATGDDSIAWNTRKMYDSNEYYSIDWENYVLYDKNFSAAFSVKWNERKLCGTDGNESASWTNSGFNVVAAKTYSHGSNSGTSNSGISSGGIVTGNLTLRTLGSIGPDTQIVTVT